MGPACPVDPIAAELKPRAASQQSPSGSPSQPSPDLSGCRCVQPKSARQGFTSKQGRLSARPARRGFLAPSPFPTLRSRVTPRDRELLRGPRRVAIRVAGRMGRSIFWIRIWPDSANVWPEEEGGKESWVIQCARLRASPKRGGTPWTREERDATPTKERHRSAAGRGSGDATCRERARRCDAVEHLLRSHPRVLSRVQPGFYSPLEAEVGATRVDTPVARRLRQAGARGDRRARVPRVPQRRRDHRRDRRERHPRPGERHPELPLRPGHQRRAGRGARARGVRRLRPHGGRRRRRRPTRPRRPRCR